MLTNNRSLTRQTSESTFTGGCRDSTEKSLGLTDLERIKVVQGTRWKWLSSLKEEESTKQRVWTRTEGYGEKHKNITHSDVVSYKPYSTIKMKSLGAWFIRINLPSLVWKDMQQMPELLGNGWELGYLQSVSPALEPWFMWGSVG